jgi:hypothetical protein
MPVPRRPALRSSPRWTEYFRSIRPRSMTESTWRSCSPCWTSLTEEQVRWRLRRTDWPQTKLEIMAMISDAFMWHQYQFQAEVVVGRQRQTLHGQEPFGLGLDRGLTLSALNNWTELLTGGDTIITFNWDILHESALWRAGKWHFADGYGFSARDAPKDARSPIKILKLHGSVNWAQKSDDDLAPEIEHKGDFFPGAVDDHKTFSKRIYGRNDGRYLIVPTYLKDLSSNRLLLRIWEQARDALVDAEQWITVGFSLNEADAAARYLFASALDRNARVQDVFVISPDPIEWDKVCYRFGKKSRAMASKFEDWLRANPLRRAEYGKSVRSDL